MGRSTPSSRGAPSPGSSTRPGRPRRIARTTPWPAPWPSGDAFPSGHLSPPMHPRVPLPAGSGRPLAFRPVRPPSDLPRRRGGRRISGRIILILVGVLFLVVVVLGRALARFYVDFLWHEGLGRSDVFWGVIRAKATLFGMFFLTFVVARRHQPGDRRPPVADAVPRQHPPVRRALPRGLRASPAPPALRRGPAARRPRRPADDVGVAVVAAVPQQPVVQHLRRPVPRRRRVLRVRAAVPRLRPRLAVHRPDPRAAAHGADPRPQRRRRVRLTDAVGAPGAPRATSPCCSPCSPPSRPPTTGCRATRRRTSAAASCRARRTPSSTPSCRR